MSLAAVKNIVNLMFSNVLLLTILLVRFKIMVQRSDVVNVKRCFGFTLIELIMVIVVLGADADRTAAGNPIFRCLGRYTRFLFSKRGRGSVPHSARRFCPP